MSEEIFQFARHYHALFAALCRSKQSAEERVQCSFCSGPPSTRLIVVNQFLKHYRLHPQNREACLVCGQSFFNRTLSYVYTHFSLCLLPDRVPVDRKNLPVDRAHLEERRAASVRSVRPTLSRNSTRQTVQRRTTHNTSSFSVDVSLVMRWRPLEDPRADVATPAGDTTCACSSSVNRAEVVTRAGDTCACSSSVNQGGVTTSDVQADQQGGVQAVHGRALADRLRIPTRVDDCDGTNTTMCCGSLARSAKTTSGVAVTAFSVTSQAIRTDARHRLVFKSSSVAPVPEQQQDRYFREDAAMTVSRIQPDYLHPASDDDNPHGLFCYACDCQLQRYHDYFCDRWMDNKIRDYELLPSITFPQDRLLSNFLPNNVFRDQYHRVPGWLLDQALPDPTDRVERLRFKDTGVSSVMARLLEGVYRSRDLVLRHVYVYEFRARQILDTLLRSTDDAYVFPFSCLCSGNCFNDVTQHQLFDRLLDELAAQVDRCGDYSPSREDRLLVVALNEVRRQLDHQPVPKNKGRETAAEDEVEDEEEESDAGSTRKPTIRVRRAHRSTAVNQQRAALFLELLEYLRVTFEQGQRRAINCHRHVLVCFRSEKVWLAFTAAYCHRFINTAQVFRLPDQRYAEAYEYLARHPFATFYSNRLQNLPHVFNTVAYMSRPSQSCRHHFNFYKLLVQLRDLQTSWCELEDTLATADTEALYESTLAAQQELVRVFARRLVSNQSRGFRSSRGSKCSNNGGLKLFGHVARFFLYERFAGFSAFTMQHLYRLFVHCSWQPKSWENDHFYIATPLIDHGLLMYWSLVDGCLAEQVNLVLCNTNFKTRHDEVSALLFRVNQHQLYTRLGYIFPYVFAHYPLEHRLPLRPDAQASVVRLPGCSVRVELRERKPHEPQRRIALLGQLFDMLIYLTSATTGRFAKRLLATRNFSIIKHD